MPVLIPNFLEVFQKKIMSFAIFLYFPNKVDKGTLKKLLCIIRCYIYTSQNFILFTFNIKFNKSLILLNRSIMTYCDWYNVICSTGYLLFADIVIIVDFTVCTILLKKKKYHY